MLLPVYNLTLKGGPPGSTYDPYLSVFVYPIVTTIPWQSLLYCFGLVKDKQYNLSGAGWGQRDHWFYFEIYQCLIYPG